MKRLRKITSVALIGVLLGVGSWIAHRAGWLRAQRSPRSPSPTAAYVVELKQPGDPIRVLVTADSSRRVTSGVAIFRRELGTDECVTPIPPSNEIVCSKVEEVISGHYVFSGVVGKYDFGRYKLTKIVAKSDGKEEEYLWGRDFHDELGVLVMNHYASFGGLGACR